MLCKRWISYFIGFPFKLALKAEDAHHLGSLGLAAFLLSFAVDRHFGLSSFPQASQFWGINTLTKQYQ